MRPPTARDRERWRPRTRRPVPPAADRRVCGGETRKVRPDVEARDGLLRSAYAVRLPFLLADRLGGGAGLEAPRFLEARERVNGAGSYRGRPVIGLLSGGERNRVHLAKVLREGGIVLLLDEPTNDLDVETLRALEGGLLTFPGCAVVISHDRWFLDRIATHLLAFEGDSRVAWFQGNYAEYEKDRRRRLGDEADRPHRIRYKPL